MTLWELACYFAVFLGGVAGGWITCAVFTSAKVQELSSECAQLDQKWLQAREREDYWRRRHNGMCGYADFLRDQLETIGKQRTTASLWSSTPLTAPHTDKGKSNPSA